MRLTDLIGSKQTFVHPVWHTSDRQDFVTPSDVFDPLHAEFGFTLDVCATAANAKVLRFYSPEDDGLIQPWIGVCWMNPPYRDAKHWMRRAAHACDTQGVTVVALIPTRTDAAWWHAYVWDADRHCPRPNRQIRFMRRRVRFLPATQPAPFSSCIVVFQPGIK